MLNKDKLVFYTCVLAACVVFLVWGADAKACTDNKATLHKIEKQLTWKIYHYYFDKLQSNFSPVEISLMWAESKNKAHMITIDNFSCREFDLMKVRVLKKLNTKQRKG